MPNGNCHPDKLLIADSNARKPYAPVAGHNVTKGRYITSNDPRGYIPVYEYPLRGQWIMMDIDDGYILWTGIWKALGHSKADIVKFLDSEPDVAPRIRRIRGGYLKIQGTWMPYEIALRLSRRVAWEIRFDLVPLFGPTFPSTCLSPDQPGFGQIISAGGRQRRTDHGPLVPTLSTPFSAAFLRSNSRPQDLSEQPRWSPYNQHKLNLPSQNQESTRLLQRPATSLGTRRQNRYVPYSDPGKLSYGSSPSKSQYDDVSPSQYTARVRAVRQSWPPAPSSTVSLPPIITFDNIHNLRSRDPPSVVLQRLREDSLLPHQIYPTQQVYSKAILSPQSSHAMLPYGGSNETPTSSPVYRLRNYPSSTRSSSSSPSLSPCTYQTPFLNNLDTAPSGHDNDHVCDGSRNPKSNSVSSSTRTPSSDWVH